MWLWVAVIGTTATCCYSRLDLTPSPGRSVVVEQVELGSETVELRMAWSTSERRNGPLLLYATGDGGWRSADRQLFGALVDRGYPVAGFPAPEYLKHLGGAPGPVSPLS